MFKEFLLKKMLKAKGVPENQVDLILTLVEKNPALFTKITGEIQAKIKRGQDQMPASLEVMTKYQDEVQKMLAEIKN